MEMIDEQVSRYVLPPASWPRFRVFPTSRTRCWRPQTVAERGRRRSLHERSSKEADVFGFASSRTARNIAPYTRNDDVVEYEIPLSSGGTPGFPAYDRGAPMLRSANARPWVQIRDNMKLDTAERTRPRRRRRANEGEARRVGCSGIWPVELEQREHALLHALVIATSGAQDWMHGRVSPSTARCARQSAPEHCHGPAENRGVATNFRMRDTAPAPCCSVSAHEHC